ncbi:MAG: MFS transporter, partial [Spirochaetota bacterium]
ISQHPVLFAFTIIGTITFIGRLFDGFTNPFIATWSDRCKSKIGRRRFFMALSAAPFAVLSFLIFFPPVQASSWVNVAYLTIILLLFYFFFVAYATPYTSLISELGHTPNERLTISTAISITWALGFLVGQGTYKLKDIFAGMFFPDLFADPATKALANMYGVQITFAIFAGIALICMLLPVIFIDERKYSEFHVSEQGVWSALSSALKNRNFMRFVCSDFLYWVSLNFIQSGMVYFVTILLKLPDSYVTYGSGLMFILSFFLYVPVNLVTQKIGKKKILVFAFVIFSIVFVLTALMGTLPIPPVVHLMLIMVIAAVPMAIFGILPNALVGDVAEADGITTGNYKAGIFYGTRTFIMNCGIAIAILVFPSFLLIGRNSEMPDMIAPAGPIVGAVAAVVFCILGMLIFLTYNEKEVQAILDTKHKK